MALGCCRQGKASQERVGGTQPASVPRALLQGLLSPVSGVLGDSELPVPSSLCQLGSCPFKALVGTIPVK